MFALRLLCQLLWQNSRASAGMSRSENLPTARTPECPSAGGCIRGLLNERLEGLR